MTDTDYKKMWINERALRIKAENEVFSLKTLFQSQVNRIKEFEKKAQTNEKNNK